MGLFLQISSPEPNPACVLPLRVTAISPGVGQEKKEKESLLGGSPKAAAADPDSPLREDTSQPVFGGDNEEDSDEDELVE